MTEQPKPKSILETLIEAAKPIVRDIAEDLGHAIREEINGLREAREKDLNGANVVQVESEDDEADESSRNLKPIIPSQARRPITPLEFCNTLPPFFGEDPAFLREDIIRNVAVFRHAINSDGGMSFHEGCYALGVVAGHLAHKSQNPLELALAMQSMFEQGFDAYDREVKRLGSVPANANPQEKPGA